ncbi:MAG: DUF1801 domain-containing protein [Sinomicrobium sp.]|nr:DUF1801 domain-containing protein [Sinomicrobium sp.]
MNKMQPLDFETVADFLDYLPDHERKIVDQLRGMILDCIPDCTEKLSYNVPFYYRHSRICFIWPPSVPWGKFGPVGVQLGFCHGNLLRDEINYLEKGDRKQVYIKTFTNSNAMETDLIKAYIFDAVDVDAQLKMNKKHSLRK